MNYTVIGKPNCKWCEKARELLEEHGKAHEYIDTTLSPAIKTILLEGGYVYVPQVFDPRGEHIGGFLELREHLVVLDNI